MKTVNVLLRNVPGAVKQQAVRVADDASDEDVEAAKEALARRIRVANGWPEVFNEAPPREKNFTVLREGLDGKLELREYRRLRDARQSLDLGSGTLRQAIIVIDRCNAGSHPVERVIWDENGRNRRVVPYANW